MRSEACAKARGFALIAVLVALAILLALVTPFLASMLNEQGVARNLVDEKRAQHQVKGLRDLMIKQAADHFLQEDESEFYDSLGEYPAQLALPEAFKSQQQDKGVLRSGEIEGLQRRIPLNTASPLLLANLLGLSASLDEAYDFDAETIAVDSSAEFFPEENGSLLVDGEVIHYGRRDGNEFLDLQRTLKDHNLPAESLVLDYRMVRLVTWPFDGRRTRKPYRTVKEVARAARFTAREMDLLLTYCTVYSSHEFSPEWGRAERVFDDLVPDPLLDTVLRTRSAEGLGAGSVVRIRSLDGKQQEYAFVRATQRPASELGTVNLQSHWLIVLLEPVQHQYKGFETVVEPLIPHPININTAPLEVLVATLQNLRRNPSRVPMGHGNDPDDPRARLGLKITETDAAAMAGEIVALRSGEAEDASEQPFDGWQSLAERFFKPRAEAAENDRATKSLLLLVMQNWLYGRSPSAEMATAPICFTSSPLVRYRVATMLHKRSGVESARRELLGIASVMPDHALDLVLAHQDHWQENFRLSRLAPYYTTYPVNVGALNPYDLGTNPADVAVAYLVALLNPGLGFGYARYASRGGAQDGVRSTTSVARQVVGPIARRSGRQWVHESFRFARHPEGRDTQKEGVYQMYNSGPSAGSGGRGVRRPIVRGHDRTYFPFTRDLGMPDRLSVSFWFRLKSGGPQALFDFSAQDPDRNRVNLRIEDEHLVFEVLDEAGLDPDPGQSRTSPERTAAQWRVNLKEVQLEPNVDYHVNISADGNRPGQLQLFLDGGPRSKPLFHTFLAQEIPEYKRPNAGVGPMEDDSRFPEIHVESTEHFPAMGTLRIGRELFVYTEKDETTFYCQRVDSMGERKARQRWREFRQDITVDEKGRPTINIDELTGPDSEDVVAAIPVGAGVELYGYAAPIYRNLVVTSGDAQLKDELGAFAIARGFLKNPKPVVLRGKRTIYKIGLGLLEDTTDDIELADPLPDEKGKGGLPKKADDIFSDAFPASGGYAVLVQWIARWVIGLNPDRDTGEMLVGGAELIRYKSRKGNVLSGIERAVTLPGLKMTGRGYAFDGKAKKFITDWENNSVLIQKRPVRRAELPRLVLYVVPISIPLSGKGVADPADSQYTEWAQIYPEDDERETEWVRYNVLHEGHIIRATPGAFESVNWHLTRQTAEGRGELGPLGPVPGNSAITSAWVYAAPPEKGVPGIGYYEKLEYDYPVVYQARLGIAFRGDPWTGTTSHAHAANTRVLPTHRLELDWGNLGALTARCGRNDRVAMVGGTKASGESRPPLEWHNINWVVQRQGHDRRAQGRNSTSEFVGQWPFQLVGYKEQVTNLFVGPGERNDFLDTRRSDRVVKFPSGELPAAYVEGAFFGGVNKALGDYTDSGAMIDEVAALGRVSDQLVIMESFTEEAQEFFVHPHVRLYPYGPITVAQDVTRTVPNTGGLLMVDGELIAFKGHGDGRFEIAENGRGLLGTEIRAHARGSRVHYLAQVPAAILAAGVSVSDHQLVVQSLGSLPRHGGTVRLGNELLHYSWTVLNNMLGMPAWYDPEHPQTEGVGLFRGRYGTVPQAGSSGEVLIWYPFRYWDRYHERAEDPELAYYQATLAETPVYFRGLRWGLENPAPEFLDVHCLVRIDQACSFADEPKKTPGLFLFEKGDIDGKPNGIDWQGSLLEARFVTIYKPGAFDPESYSSIAWKQAPMVKDLILDFEGESRILDEKVSAR